MNFTVSEEIASPADRVWAVLADVTDWPRWTPTVSSVRLLGDGGFGPDGSAEVRQPRLGRNVWRVTAFEPGRRFEWVATGPGVRTRGDHRLTPLGDGRTRAELALETSGPLAPLVDLLLGRLSRRYVTTEAASLRRRCENGPA
ncbi:MAG TPA: SRPBCC family protein [Pseudonocardia sp.]